MRSLAWHSKICLLLLIVHAHIIIKNTSHLHLIINLLISLGANQIIFFLCKFIWFLTIVCYW